MMGTFLDTDARCYRMIHISAKKLTYHLNKATVGKLPATMVPGSAELSPGTVLGKP